MVHCNHEEYPLLEFGDTRQKNYCLAEGLSAPCCVRQQNYCCGNGLPGPLMRRKTIVLERVYLAPTAYNRRREVETGIAAMKSLLFLNLVILMQRGRKTIVVMRVYMAPAA